MDALKAAQQWLQGRKSYIVIVVGIITAALQVFWGINIPNDVWVVLGGLLGVTMKAGQNRTETLVADVFTQIKEAKTEAAAKAPEQAQDALGGGSAQGAVKLLILAIVCACSIGLGGVRAAENPGAYIHVGPIDFTYPLAHVTATPWLWDFINSRASMAAETTFCTFPNKPLPFTLGGQTFVMPQDMFNIAYGAQTSEQAQFTPIGSLGFNFAKLTTNTGEKITNFGVWCGHDFRDTNPNRSRVITDAGIKASWPLW
jgi:hypothetical protein